MLPLDDPRWNTLWIGYAAPNRFLPALVRLRDEPSTYPAILHEFHSENYVCHQGAVYHTTLAVVPHFVHAAGRLPPSDRGDLLAAAGFYALLLNAPPPESPRMPSPPAWLVADYDQAVRAALSLTAEALAAPPSGSDPERDRLRLMAGLAGFHGQWRVGVLLTRLTESVFCRWCEAEFADPLAEWGQGF